MIERRKETRFTITAPVSWKNSNRIIEASAKDISYSGMFIETLAPCNLRGVVNVIIPMGEETLEIEGEVRWVREDEDGNATGMGIYFLRNLTESERSAMTAMLSRSLTETLIG